MINITFFQPRSSTEMYISDLYEDDLELSVKVSRLHQLFKYLFTVVFFNSRFVDKASDFCSFQFRTDYSDSNTISKQKIRPAVEPENLFVIPVSNKTVADYPTIARKIIFDYAHKFGNFVIVKVFR